MIRRSGNVIYEVDVQSSIWVRHANQLRHSYLSERPSNDTVIPLNILLDTFKLPQKVQTTCSEQSKKFPTRKTQRKCKPTSTLQGNPEQTSNKHQISRGGVGSNKKGR